MKKNGRPRKEWTPEQLRAVQEYLTTTDKSYMDIAVKYGIPVTTLKYWVLKYRRESDG
jgi:transposase-like protein